MRCIVWDFVNHNRFHVNQEINQSQLINFVMGMKYSAMRTNPLIVRMVRMKTMKHAAQVIILPMMKQFVLHLLSVIQENT